MAVERAYIDGVLVNGGGGLYGVLRGVGPEEMETVGQGGCCYAGQLRITAEGVPGVAVGGGGDKQEYGEV